jgi:hypothetical protein
MVMAELKEKLRKRGDINVLPVAGLATAALTDPRDKQKINSIRKTTLSPPA